jgi:hypothetical protein
MGDKIEWKQVKEGEFTVIPDPPEWECYDNPAKPNMAVISSDGPDRCILLHNIGFVLAQQIEVCGDDMECLQLDGLEAGIWIWEGTYIGTYDSWSGEYDTEALGEFRKPTDEEWENIKDGEEPWDRDEWKTKEGEICWDCCHPGHESGKCEHKTGSARFLERLRPCKCESVSVTPT